MLINDVVQLECGHYKRCYTATQGALYMCDTCDERIQAIKVITQNGQQTVSKKK